MAGIGDAPRQGRQHLPAAVVLCLAAWLLPFPGAAGSAEDSATRGDRSAPAPCDETTDDSAPTTDAPPYAAGTTEDGVQTSRPAPAPLAPQKVASVLSERVRVLGSAARRERIPGSATYVDAEQLARQRYDDIHRVLSMVPGVNLQEEEGYGLRPNIGFRGSGSERSSKITLMEDGVLIAPAPYAAPSAYYFPTTGRMEGVEVRKGSSSVQFGPFTNGGVLNLLSSSIPSSFGGDARISAGNDSTLRGRAKIGGAGQQFGWLVETYRFETDGFKQLDGGGPSGLELEDYLVKLRLNSSAAARTFQALELKLGKTEQLGYETYLGLTDADFARNPYRRYAGSAEDTLDTDHEQVQLRWFVRPGERFDLTTTVYRNDFFRNWHKLGKVDGGNGFVDIADVLDDPATFASELAVLRGEVNSQANALNVRNNRRTYYAQGIHAVVGFHPRGAFAGHEIEVGIRVHEDEEDRFQDEDLFRITDGRMELTSRGEPGSQSNRVVRAEAIAFHVQDEIAFDRWTVTPGFRVEMIDFERLDYGKNDPGRTGTSLSRRQNGVDELIPGVGATYRLDDSSRLFAGVHRGFAPPGAGANEETRPEESVNYEIGYRRSAGSLGLQLVGFLNDYDNLLGTDTLSAGGTGEGDLFNGGKVETYGTEAALAFDAGVARGLSVSLPIELSYTYTHAEFESSFQSDFEAWGDVQAGDSLPYVPVHQGAVGIGVKTGRWSASTNLIYQDAMRTRAGQGPLLENESTDAHLLVDLSLGYHLPSGLELFAQVRNLTDEVYIAARRPAGLRPGLPRTALIGIGFAF